MKMIKIEPFQDTKGCKNWPYPSILACAKDWMRIVYSFFRLRTDPHLNTTLYDVSVSGLRETKWDGRISTANRIVLTEKIYWRIFVLRSSGFSYILRSWDTQCVRFLIPILCAGLEEQLIYTPKKLAEDLEGNCVYVTNKYHPKGEQIRVIHSAFFLEHYFFATVQKSTVPGTVEIF